MIRRTLAALVAVLVVVCPLAALAIVGQIGRGTAVTCGTTATLADDTSVTDSEPRWVKITNPSDSAGTVYIGDATVTVANGEPLAPGKVWFTFEKLASASKVYCITASGTVSVRVQEQR